MSQKGTVIAFSLAALTVGTFLFVNGPRRKTYQAIVALDGKEPFGATFPGSSDSVVLYRHGRHGITCFDAFHSKELHDRLSAKDGQIVTVQYDTFGNGYNVHSVDGFVLANGTHVLRPDFAVTGGISGGPNGRGGFEADGRDCW
jgi:hypothetical protein